MDEKIVKEKRDKSLDHNRSIENTQNYNTLSPDNSKYRDY